MCGLFGMAGQGIIKADLDVLDQLMHVSALRGTDGTGIAAGRHYSDDISMYKIQGDHYYWKMMLPDMAEKGIYSTGNSWFLGHTRWRTTGKVDAASAQPFAFKRVVGTHNGTLRWNFDGYNTDSEKLIESIALNPENIQKVISELEPGDAYALSWVDRDKKTLNFLRNEKRPLFFCVNEKRSVIYWASELGMLKFVLERCGITEYEAYYFGNDIHYSVRLMDISCHKKGHIFKQTKIEQPKAPVVVHIGKKKENNVHPLTGETLEETNEIPWIRDTQDQQKQRMIN